jgi:hypothetical protein
LEKRDELVIAAEKATVNNLESILKPMLMQSAITTTTCTFLAGANFAAALRAAEFSMINITFTPVPSELYNDNRIFEKR